MKIRILIILAITLMLFTGCTAFQPKDINTYSEFDSKANFDGYKTYMWLGAAEIVNDPSGAWEPPLFDVDMEVKFLIDRELRKRGLTENSSSPDLVLAFALGVNMDAMEIKVDPETKLEVLENVPQGGMVIIMVDAQTGFAIWAGVAEAEVQEHPTPDTQKARLDYAVTQLIKSIP